MLVLTRKAGQKLMIADDIEVTVLEMRGDTVKLGIQAPRHVAIYREEIFTEIRRTNREAVHAGPEGLHGALEAFMRRDPSPVTRQDG